MNADCLTNVFDVKEGGCVVQCHNNDLHCENRLCEAFVTPQNQQDTCELEILNRSDKEQPRKLTLTRREHNDSGDRASWRAGVVCGFRVMSPRMLSISKSNPRLNSSLTRSSFVVQQVASPVSSKGATKLESAHRQDSESSIAESFV